MELIRWALTSKWIFEVKLKRNYLDLKKLFSLWFKQQKRFKLSKINTFFFPFFTPLPIREKRSKMLSEFKYLSMKFHNFHHFTMKMYWVANFCCSLDFSAPMVVATSVVRRTVPNPVIVASVNTTLYQRFWEIFKDIRLPLALQLWLP